MVQEDRFKRKVKKKMTGNAAVDKRCIGTRRGVMATSFQE
jgi:hypothetical protein